jgi:hypothetical protein
MNENLIIWQKWVDPFGEDDIETDEDKKFFTDDEELEENEDQLDKKKYVFGIKAIATPMGIVPMNENTASSKIFNFWLGHTNFNITKRIASIIEKTDGVETLDIFTRYRFRIAIGKAFNDSDVMRDINKKIYKEKFV